MSIIEVPASPWFSLIDAGPDAEPWERRHPEWAENVTRWRFLLDSWEGGQVYREAIYGMDYNGYPVRNLIRHKREYGEPGKTDSYNLRTGIDPSTYATDNDYELRRARTPAPTMFRDAMERHLSAIYSQEVKRDADKQLADWWGDVDGTGTKVDDWMADTVAPMLMVFGGLDVLLDHPRADDPDAIKTKADQLALGLDRCVASIILPVNLRWWKVDRRGNYLECLVVEPDADSGATRYRHWTDAGSTLYTPRGDVIESIPHPFGRVPIVRVYDRKRPRCCNVGLPRYESIAEIQREFYNRDSELILSDTLQAHPLLQGPEDYVQADGDIPVGPSWMLPKKKNNTGGMAAYEGFEYVDPPKGAAESIRLNKHDLIDLADRASLLTKPAGTKGTNNNSVSQSGVSKRLDAGEASKLLSRIARTLDKAETQIAAYARMVITDGAVQPEDREDIKVSYPTNFDLVGPEELAMLAAEFQAILSSVGNAPETEAEILKKLARMILMGLDDDEYDEIDKELEDYCQEAAKRQQQSAENDLTIHDAKAENAANPPTPIVQPAQVPVAQPAKPAQPPVAKPPKPSAP